MRPSRGNVTASKKKPTYYIRKEISRAHYSMGAGKRSSMSEELTTTRTLEVIGAEIRAHAISMEFHMRGTINEAIEIGRRLVEARNVAKHGEWMPFLEQETPFSYDKANNLIKVFEAYGDQQKSLFGTELSNFDTYQNLSFSQALALLSVPEEERAEFVEENHVEDMTTRELQQAIRERDEARKTVEGFEEDNKELAAKLRQKEERIKELEARPVDVAVQVDENAVKEAADEARRAADAEWSEKLKAAEDKLAKAEEKARKAAEKAKTAGADATKETAAELETAKAEADRLRAELEAAKKEAKAAAATADAEVATFKLYANAVVEYASKMRELLLKVRDREDKTVGEKLTAALAALGDAVKEAAK